MSTIKINPARLLLLIAVGVCVPAFMGHLLHAQGIGFNNNNATANSSAMIDISAGTGGNRGLLIPRVTSAQRTGANFNPLAAPCQGLMVYQTDAAAPGEGFYCNTSTTTTPNWVKIGSTAWGLTGNSGTSGGTNFLGTTDVQGLDIRTSNAVRMSILSGGNIGINATNPQVRLAINGNGANIYNTDLWVENNIHVQGNEALVTIGGRGRLRVGTAWGYMGLYSDASSLGATNDLVLGASSGNVRIGPGGVAHKLYLPAGTGFQMVDNAAPNRILLCNDASGNGTWHPISDALQIFTRTATKILINSTSYMDVTGLSQTVVVTTNSWVIINTSGSLESQGFASGSYSRCIVALENNGTNIQEQAVDIVNTTSPALNQMVSHWGLTYAFTVVPGTYTFKVKGRIYAGDPFNAGGASTTTLPSDGAMTIEVYAQ